DGPVRLVVARQVEAPEVSLQGTRVNAARGVISVQTGRERESDAVGARRATRLRAEVIEGRGRRVRFDGHDEDAGIAGCAAVTVAEYDRPLAVVQSSQLRWAVGVAEIAAAARPARSGGAADRRGIPLAHHQTCGSGLGEVRGRRVGDVEREDGVAAGPETAREPGVPLPAVEQVA